MKLRKTKVRTDYSGNIILYNDNFYKKKREDKRSATLKELGIL